MLHEEWEKCVSKGQCPAIMKGVHLKREPALTWTSEDGVEYIFNLDVRSSTLPCLSDSDGRVQALSLILFYLLPSFSSSSVLSRVLATS